MLVLQYHKLYPSSLAGHVDTLRTIMRILRRSKCKVGYSVGFNPHMLVFNSPALAVGIDSMCEYVAVDMQYQDNLLDTLNKVSPKGICFVALWQVDNINLSNLITKASYLIDCCGIASYADSLTSSNYQICYKQKGEMVTKNVAHQIHQVEVVDKDHIKVTVDCGNSSLRVDRLVAMYLLQCNADYDYSIVKQSMYVGQIDILQYLNQISTRF